MPFESIDRAREEDFPTQIHGTSLTLEQINRISAIHDALKSQDNTDNPMAVALSRFLSNHSVLDEGENQRWVEQKSGMIVKADRSRRTVLQALWVPDEVDRDNEFVKFDGEKGLESAFYQYAIRKADQLPPEMGIEHDDTRGPVEGILVVQDYLLLEDTVIDGVRIPKNSWMRETHFKESAQDVYEEVLSGGLSGISPQGLWRAKP